MNLREWLLAKQQELGEGDAAFARRLSAALEMGATPISRQQWRSIRLGEEGVSLKIAGAAYGAFPNEKAHICELALGRGQRGDAAA